MSKLILLGYIHLHISSGQPLGVMMYYHDYVVDHFGEEEIKAFADLTIFQNTSTTAAQ